ncbi:hypothetical protein CCB80_09770 [Armatimonadetes bacterium Uphvl-Ar1]|nr:hypothetical protein CCB80_09770 [Armatimonadetes bacterium Uphvl-Ar1]
MARIRYRDFGVFLALVLIGGCNNVTQSPITQKTQPAQAAAQNPIVRAARAQLEKPAQYSGAYYKIDYPMGDVPANRGACTDVIIRALRPVGIDLQKAVQEDAKVRMYPRMLIPDRNIDHRRCPNLIHYFSNHAESIPSKTKEQSTKNIKPGDIIFWKLPGNKDHVGIASDASSPKGHPLIIHNIGPHVKEEDVLFRWPIVAHFRIEPLIHHGTNSSR